MAKKIRVTILDDHQSTIDGYVYRLGHVPELEIVATLRFGEDLGPSLESHPTDVLVLDFSLRISPENPNLYPTLTEIPKLLQLYPNLDVLMISMFAERSIIRAVMEAGASGYVLKDDAAAIQDLANVIISVADGGIFLSERAGQLYQKHSSELESNLSRRQLEVLLLCAAFPSSKTAELAQKMCVSNSTVRNLLSGAYLKLDAHTRAGALEKARQLGLLKSEIPTTPLI
jgi:DNA-binding NarL/FixJ family response regulator